METTERKWRKIKSPREWLKEIEKGEENEIKKDWGE